jgi:t-SNARE complex subunit (syntaxin)
MNFQPEVYRYILETYLGGWARLANQTLDFAKEPTGKNIPIVQGFLGKGFDYTPQNKYKKNTEVLAKVVNRIDKLSDAQLQREVARNPVALDPRVIEAYQEADRALQRLYRQRREDLRTEGLDENGRRAVTEYYRIEMNKVQSAFNYVYNAVEEGV